VTITPTAPVVSITAPPAGTRVFAGTSVPFAATAIDATDGNVGATLRWISNLDGPIGTGASLHLAGTGMLPALPLAVVLAALVFVFAAMKTHACFPPARGHPMDELHRTVRMSKQDESNNG